MQTSPFPKREVLIVDDERMILDSMALVLESQGIKNVAKCSDSTKVMDLLAAGETDLVLLDLNMPRLSGDELLKDIRLKYPHIPVIIITAEKGLETAVQCMRHGADDYVVKPVDKNRLLIGIRHAMERSELKSENASLRKMILTHKLKYPDIFSKIITKNASMISIFQYIEAISESHRPVLITGDSGTGKELVAQAIHRTSTLDGEFVTVNVAGLDDSVFSDTLFGHVKGAFTGAEGVREGLIARASGGTLLLDEIGDLDPSSQTKLLRLIQEEEYYQLGSDTLKHSDTRIICSTNKNIDAQNGRTTFRSDLYYRLKTHHIHIPPLRERREDIPYLVDHFVGEAARTLGKKKPTILDHLLTALNSYDFPGNVRELQSMIFDAVSRCKPGEIAIPGLVHPDASTAHRQRVKHQTVESDTNVIQFSEKLPTLKQSADMLVKEAMKRSNNNQPTAARHLGITQQALSKRLKQM